MLKIFSAEELSAYEPELEQQMFAHRTEQFVNRLGWDLAQDDTGFEKDEYDDPSSYYLIWKSLDDAHLGSMRIRPSYAPIMVNDHFLESIGTPIRDAKIWETTRFCLAPELRRGSARVSAALMQGGCAFALMNGIEATIGVFDQKMLRIYKSLGFAPEVLGWLDDPSGRIGAGIWRFSEEIGLNMERASGVSFAQIKLWLRGSLTGRIAPREVFSSAA